ncbi:MAG: hypothetical protein DRN01_06120 [Thermoplasmata archaeon]|nr:MAG: hypothetical protein DRN01_06120 [Thermoplasmata archaeon]
MFSRRLFIFALVILFFTPPLTAYQSTHDKKTFKAALSREVEIPPESDYYIEFIPDNFILKEKTISPCINGFSEKVKDAVARSPRWIQKPLSRQFHSIDAEPYADLILNVSKKYVDEIAFTIAFSSVGNVPPVDLVKDNVFSLYEADEWLDYVRIVDYDEGDGNYYSTIRYRVIEDGVEKVLEYPPEVYYWYVVHPEAAGEEPSYVYNRFWRSYLFNHNDIGYPLLKEKLSGIRYLWDNESYFQPKQRSWEWSINNHPTAVEAVSYWIGKTVPAQATGDRPGQPNVIAHEHNGWCGELQKIAVAALRTSLVPSVGVCDLGEDHVWREFYERGWHENDNWWSDGGGAVDKPDVYVYGWGKDISALFAWKGDDSIYDVTSRYIHPENRRTVRFVVTDMRHQPVDGARVVVLVNGPRDITWLKNKVWGVVEKIWSVIPDLVKGRILQMLYKKLGNVYDKIPDGVNGVIQSIWNYTDINGECSFELGENRSYLFLVQYGNLKKPWQPALHNTLRVLSEPRDTTFKIVFPFISTCHDKHRETSLPSGDTLFNISFSTSSYQIHQSTLWMDDKGVYEKKGKVSFFVVNETNFEKYVEGKRFICGLYRDVEKDNLAFNTAEDRWYLVFRNNARFSTVVLNLSLAVTTPTSGAAVQIFFPHTDVFDHPVFDVGETVAVKGVATGNVSVFVDEVLVYISNRSGEWCYRWNTSGEQIGDHLIRAVCGDTYDVLKVTLLDVSPPTVKIKEPLGGEVVEGGVVEFSGWSDDNVGVKLVEVSIDGGGWRVADGTVNWSVYWDVNGLEPGDHVAVAKAVDRNGREFFDEINLVVNESGHSWGPKVNLLYHLPQNPVNSSNIVVYANVTEEGPFSIQRVVLFWDDSEEVGSREMYRYGCDPVQSRHEEDPLKNTSNSPLFGLEFGQLQLGTNVTYWVLAFDTARNVKESGKQSFTVG